MSALMERIGAAFEARTGIEVPEWPDEEGAPTVIYAKPYTIQDDKALARFIKDDDPTGFVEVLVRKAEDESGEPLFDKGDKPKLARRAKAHVLKRVALAIMASETLEEAEGN